MEHEGIRRQDPRALHCSMEELIVKTTIYLTMRAILSKLLNCMERGQKLQ